MYHSCVLLKNFRANIFGLSEDDGKNTIQRTGQELFIESGNEVK